MAVIGVSLPAGSPLGWLYSIQPIQRRFDMTARTLFLALFLPPALLAADRPATPAPTLRQAIFVNPDDPSVREVRRIGETAATWISRRLINEAASSVVRYRPVDGLGICHLLNLPESGPPLPELPRVTAIKRTSLRLRNPANAPDALEGKALDRIRTSIEAGAPPPPLLLQRVDYADGVREWRVYQPVTVGPQCAACHGPPEAQPENLRAVLRERYPTDAAVGYRWGEWRGLIRVTVADAPAAGKPGSPSKR